MAEGGDARDLGPQGEALRRALRWLDERAREDPRLDRMRLLAEASSRFDLSPVEEEFLATRWARPSS